jgi:Ni,Fe-hydrogenase III large subunit
MSWDRRIVGADEWIATAIALAAGRPVLKALWAEPLAVHMAIMDEETAETAILTLDCPDFAFPSIAAHHPPALRPERAIFDLYGIRSVGCPDARPWLDHGRWGVRHPLAASPELLDGTLPFYEFLMAQGESLHQIPVGPVHAGIIEPGHFRFTANGETVVRLEERLGYVHKGIEGLMAGAPLDRAAKLAGRTSGDSVVAYGIAFAQAAETALGIAPPDRAVWLRGLMAELERLANHFGDIGAICNDAAFALMLAHCGVLREWTLRTAEICFGHRLMRDRVVPGGVTADLTDRGGTRLRALIKEVRRRFPRLITLYDETASLQERTVGTGILKPALARQYACGGPIGRASGRSFDARRSPGYPPYDGLRWEVPVLDQGDVNARVWVRIREVAQSLDLIEQMLDTIPPGPIAADLPEPAGSWSEGTALVEGFRGDILVWLRIDEAGRVERCHLRDPSWFQWPVLEAAIEGNIVADFPLCNKSFNCSYSGHDL